MLQISGLDNQAGMRNSYRLQKITSSLALTVSIECSSH